ncbi:MAG: PorT family protein [Bacteroidales bacterium]|nr:PorT family protein [Bacteroidales bacterium]
MNKYFLIIALVFFSTNIYSQTFGGGAMAGLSTSQLDGDNWGGYAKAGLTFGIYTNTKINKYIDAQLELRYVQKGSKSDNKDQSVFYLSKLNYIELPLFLKYRFLDKFSASIGFAAGYLQKSTEDKDGIGDEPADPPFNEFEFSGLAGIEYLITEHLFFNVRFNYSILPVRSHPGEQTSWIDKGQYNNVLTFTVYYQIANFGKK